VLRATGAGGRLVIGTEVDAAGAFVGAGGVVTLTPAVSGVSAFAVAVGCGVLLARGVFVDAGVLVGRAVAVGALAVSALMSAEAVAVAFRRSVAWRPCGVAAQIMLTTVHIEHNSSKLPQPIAALPVRPFDQMRLTNCIIAAP